MDMHEPPTTYYYVIDVLSIVQVVGGNLGYTSLRVQCGVVSF